MESEIKADKLNDEIARLFEEQRLILKRLEIISETPSTLIDGIDYYFSLNKNLLDVQERFIDMVKGM
jgi:hypothetical protein